tara:strand:- start:420 stop:656 length:237 start_codon:yes stop_codon:yes gene_type:complete
MLSVTFTLTNREKTFTADSLDKCCVSFFKDYPEAVSEVKKIHLTYNNKPEEEMIVKGKESCATMLKGLQLSVIQREDK